MIENFFKATESEKAQHPHNILETDLLHEWRHDNSHPVPMIKANQGKLTPELPWCDMISAYRKRIKKINIQVKYYCSEITEMKVKNPEPIFKFEYLPK